MAHTPDLTIAHGKNARRAPGPWRMKKILALMKEIHEKSGGTYGSSKIKEALAKAGWKVNHKRVERLMKIGGLRSRNFPEI